MIGDNQENLLFELRDGATAKVLLSAGANPNVVGEFGRTPLTTAQNGEVARVLIRRGADLKPKLKGGATLLEYAVNNTRRADDTAQEQASYIEELLAQGAEFDPKGNGVRAMLSAAFLDRVGERCVFSWITASAPTPRTRNRCRSTARLCRRRRSRLRTP